MLTQIYQLLQCMSCLMAFSKLVVWFLIFAFLLFQWGSQDMSEGSVPLRNQHWTAPPYPHQPPPECIMFRERVGVVVQVGPKAQEGFLVSSRCEVLELKKKTSWLWKRWPNLAIAASASYVSLGLLLFPVFNRSNATETDQYPQLTCRSSLCSKLTWKKLFCVLLVFFLLFCFWSLRIVVCSVNPSSAIFALVLEPVPFRITVIKDVPWMEGVADPLPMCRTCFRPPHKTTSYFIFQLGIFYFQVQIQFGFSLNAQKKVFELKLNPLYTGEKGRVKGCCFFMSCFWVSKS